MARRAYDRKRPDVAFAIEMGWEFCGFAGSGHLQFRHPKVAVRLIMPATPSEGRGTKNSIAWVKRNTPREE
ncbi:hicA toxin superfamily protein [Nocardia phage NTR1]|jgi:predicted RNA binding protein YcfA (HicA-like mRNA interferase family)|nr:hicA toxin superfamily protein [Nocardia phage NTR1]